jgi:hypothetical protein
MIPANSSTGCRCHIIHRLSPSQLGKELSFGLEPVSAGIAGEGEPMASLGNEERAEPNLFVGRSDSLSCLSAGAGLCLSDRRIFLSRRLARFRSRRGAVRRNFFDFTIGCESGGLPRGIVLVLSFCFFSWHGLNVFYRISADGGIGK